MGQKPKGTLQITSNLLQQLIHSAQELEEAEQLGEGESSESSESEMPNLEEEFDGLLKEEAVAKALHELGRSGPGTEQVYLNLNLSHHDLVDVSILCEYVHLQKLNLSANKIEDLSCVSCMPYLLELNASQNKLTTFFNFMPPKNLKRVDFSSNKISEMGDLSAYHALTHLILDNNEIEEIGGLEMCISLTHLSLTGNKIKTISGLNALPIKILSLSNNQIKVITGLEDLRTLQNLDLSHNQISSLQGLENHDLLEVINLEDNKIAELGEIEYIENLPILRILNLLRNPIQEKSEYWLFVIFMLLRLTELDQKKIKVEEKVSAVNKYDPPPEVVAAQDHMTHVVNSMMQPQRIFDSTLPSLDTPYPMLVLVGPQACGKRELAQRLCRQFNTYFRYGACHTTRPPYFGEGDRVDYHFISQEVFDEMLSMGKFILTFKYGNHSYGLNRDTVEGIARDGLASCIHMEIEGVRSLKYSYFEPRYILVVPMNKEKYEGYLRRKGLFSRAEIEFAVSRVDLYVKINQEFPGYFDAVINADDLDVAYQKLSELIKEYLGLTEEPAKTLAPTTAGAPSSRKTVSGVPAHLVPSPRRLAKLQADGPTTEPRSQAEAAGSQDPAPSPGRAPRGHLPSEAEAGADADVGRAAELPPSATSTAREADEAPGDPALRHPSPSAQGEGPSSDSPPPGGAPPDPPLDPGRPGSPPPPPPPPPEGELPPAEAVRAGSPHAGPPAPRAAQARERGRPPGALLPTRLPQPRTLAPLQSRRPTPRLPAVGPALCGPPRDSSPPEGKGAEAKLRVVSAAPPEPAPRRTPSPGEREAPSVRLPRLPTPFIHAHAPPAEEMKTPKAGHPSSENTPDTRASPHSLEPEPHQGAGKKTLPVRGEAAAGAVHPRRGPRSHGEPASADGPLPKDPQSPEEKKGKAYPTRRKPQTNLAPEDLAQNAGSSKKGRLAQESKSAPSGDQPTQEGQPAQAPSQTGQDTSAPAGRPGRRDLRKKRRSLKREAVLEPPGQESEEPPTQQPAHETQAHKGTGQARERSVQGHNPLPSKQQTKEKRTRKNGGVSQDRSPPAPQNAVSGEEQGSRTGRLRARGSQSIKV